MAVRATYILHLEEFNSQLKAHVIFQLPKSKNASVSVTKPQVDHRLVSFTRTVLILWVSVKHSSTQTPCGLWKDSMNSALDRIAGPEQRGMGAELAVVYPPGTLPSPSSSGLTRLLPSQG